jgi:serine phosphatase RsbU (regulator of sigma subunit)
MLNNLISNYQVGAYGVSFVINPEGILTSGKMKGAKISEVGLSKADLERPDSFFRGKYFGIDALYRIEQLRGGYKLLLEIPFSEVYWSRNILSYETALADILLFSIVYAMIYLLMQVIVVKNLNEVNDSLSKITDGDLQEVVDVRSSLEFASLSDDINETVDALKGYISEAEHRYEKELEMARTIQLSALPRDFVFSEISEIELFAQTDPAREVGGDFYDFFFVGRNRLAIVMADVSGKGIPAALFMMRSKASIRSLAETGSAPAEIFYKVNNLLCEGNDADMFVTAWIGIIDLTTGEMCCANAGHEYPALKRADGPYELIKDRHGLPLAAMEEMWYTEYPMTLQPGDKLFLYTDGVPEAINKNEEQYGTDRMLAALDAVRNESMEDTIFAVRDDMNSFVGTADQFDDITMLGFTLRNYVAG